MRGFILLDGIKMLFRYAVNFHASETFFKYCAISGKLNLFLISFSWVIILKYSPFLIAAKQSRR